MCLQEYLYIYCKTIVYAISRHGLVTDGVVYGLNQICRLCNNWQAFFTPNFLVDNCARGHGMGAVIRQSRLIAMLYSMCQDLLYSYTLDDLTSVELKSRILLVALNTVFLEDFEQYGYNQGDSCKYVYFPQVERYLVSFTPISGADSPDCAPGIFNDLDYAVIRCYLKLVSQAPAMHTIFGVEEGAFPTPILKWVEASNHFVRPDGEKIIYLSTQRSCDLQSICEDVYQWWLHPGSSLR